jgi:hypothetical protein
METPRHLLRSVQHTRGSRCSSQPNPGDRCGPTNAGPNSLLSIGVSALTLAAKLHKEPTRASQWAVIQDAALDPQIMPSLTALSLLDRAPEFGCEFGATLGLEQVNAVAYPGN